jgi:hypothetical protein
METQNTYNGWTNYATWRIALEIFDGYEAGYKITADDCAELVEEVLFSSGSGSNLSDSYARAFLSDVNYYEIANNLNEAHNY